MTLQEAIAQRHSVRQYEDRALSPKHEKTLRAYINKVNDKSGLRIQLITDEPKAFSGPIAKCMKFAGCRNYIALVGKKTEDLDERCGYYGEYLVLKATQMGLNTCWVALTYSKIKNTIKVSPDEKLCCVIAIGYGINNGFPHKSKPVTQVIRTNGIMPNWFREGVKCALLAPTAMNQQKFMIELVDKRVSITAPRSGYQRIDLGIVRLHFEIGAGKENFEWLLKDRKRSNAKD